jgi:predicted membrane-bound dolichyl-phosphate-mannose-protein mannosyltransferase
VERTAELREGLAAGIVAGIAGGILIDLFFLATAVASGSSLGAAIAGLYDFVASAAIGRAAVTHPGSGIPLGIVLHFCVSIGWALGYVYLARSQRQLVRRPVVSGLVFGAIVFLFMSVTLVAAGLSEHPASAIAIGLIGHVVFYGLPVALVVARMLPRPSLKSGRPA